MEKLKLFLKIMKIGLRQFFAKKIVQNVLIISAIVSGAIIGGFFMYLSSAPAKFTDEELIFFEDISETMYKDGIDNVNVDIRKLYNSFKDVEITIPSETEIKISVDSNDASRYIISDFSIPDSPEITDHYSYVNQIFFTVVGAIGGAVTVLAIFTLIHITAKYIVTFKGWFDTTKKEISVLGPNDSNIHDNNDADGASCHEKHGDGES